MRTTFCRFKFPIFLEELHILYNRTKYNNDLNILYYNISIYTYITVINVRRTLATAMWDVLACLCKTAGRLQIMVLPVGRDAKSRRPILSGCGCCSSRTNYNYWYHYYYYSCAIMT
jgi:hypothetical protein